MFIRSTRSSRTAINLALVALLSFVALSCNKRSGTARFKLLDPEVTGIHFANTITENDSVNLLDYEYVYNGGGVAVVDVNSDELPDLFFSGNMVPNKLYLNLGEMKFRDITESSGITRQHWATGVAVADVNSDGLQDIYVCSAGHLSESGRANALYVNNGDNTFTESAAAYGIDDTGFSTMAAFLDYDLDGDLDLYIATYSNDTWDTSVVYPKVTDGSGKATDRFYRNNGNGTFTNVSKEAGILTEGYGLGVSITDLNQDGWPDIYVSNDYIDDDFIYVNNGDGTFTESASKYLNHISHFAMGNDIADVNNDGYPDIMVVDMQPEDNERQKLFSVTKNYDKFMMTLKMGYLPAYMRNTLQLNNGDGTFSEIGQLAGVHHTDWSWAPLLSDLDNDGRKDLFITNGYPKDIMNRDFLVFNKYATSIQSVKTPPSLKEQHRYELQAINELQGSKISNYVFSNNGNLTFQDRSAEWGISQQKTFSNGAAYADLDNDGDLDLIVNNINDNASILENRSEIAGPGNYIRLRLSGDSLNRFALGAKVRLYAAGNGVQYQENYPFRGFQSTVEPVVHFGLGNHSSVDSITIEWPDGRFSLLRDVKANRVVSVDQSEAGYRSKREGKVKKELMFENATASLGVNFTHAKRDFNDFKVQPLLPHKFSQSGPGLAAGDVNGDGLPDFYIGGTQQSPGALFCQTRDGNFVRKNFPHESGGDDMAALFFDADGDGDQDLYVVTGGYEQMAETPYYQDRLYVNDGEGNFNHDTAALPETFESGSCVAAADYDADGDIDLFVGGRIHPSKYPLPGRSYLLQNQNGRFSVVTEQAGGPSFSRMGMVTSAIWTDFDNDGQLDLMVAGEWMPITVFKNQQGQFTNVTRELGLENTTGWWNSLASGDFDSDGDTDYIAGNMGMNSRYKPTAEEPLNLYTKDFDDNGTLDPFLTYYLGGQQHVVHSRDEVVAQLPNMRRKFPRYGPFAKATFKEIFTEKDLENAYVLECKTFTSSYIENKGDGTFAVRPLPVRAQFAPIQGIAVLDANADGNLDLLAVGNSYDTEISLGRYDASFGCLLTGDGKGNFEAVPTLASGFSIRGDAKSVAILSRANGETVVIVARHNGDAEAFINKGGENRSARRNLASTLSELISVRQRHLLPESANLSQSAAP